MLTVYNLSRKFVQWLFSGSKIGNTERRERLGRCIGGVFRISIPEPHRTIMKATIRVLQKIHQKIIKRLPRVEYLRYTSARARSFLYAVVVYGPLV